MVRHRRWRAVLLLFAVLAPFIAAWLSRFVADLDAASELISTRTVCGVVVGQLVGLQRGNLRAMIVGPVVGLLAGVADMKLFVWLFDQGQWSITTASLVPLWGAIIGAWVASFTKPKIGMKQLSYWALVLAKFAALASADFGARYLWRFYYQSQWNEPGQYAWLVESIVFLPTCVLAVAMTARAYQHGSSAAE